MKVKLILTNIYTNNTVDVLNENEERLFSLDLKFVVPAVPEIWNCIFEGVIPIIWQVVEVPHETLIVWNVISKM